MEARADAETLTEEGLRERVLEQYDAAIAALERIEQDAADKARQTAWSWLLTNLLVLPGMGSVMGGKRIGYLQAMLAISGMILSLMFAVSMVREWWVLRELPELDRRVRELDREIDSIAKSDPVAQRLQQLRGVGPLIATAMVTPAHA